MTDGGGAKITRGLAENAMKDAASATPTKGSAYGGADENADGGADQGFDDDDIEGIPDLKDGDADGGANPPSNEAGAG